MATERRIAVVMYPGLTTLELVGSFGATTGASTG